MRRYPIVYELNTWIWLQELSARAGRRISLAEVPQEELEKIRDYGFDALWLMGVWTRSPAARRLAWETTCLHAEYRKVLPDYGENDVIASPYSVRDYVVEPHLGDNRGLAALRKRLHKLGIGLILDFVPNHLAPDHRWTGEHPEYFVQGSPADQAAHPEWYFRQSDADGGHVFAYGRPPAYYVWTDTVQLDYRRSATREAMTAILLQLARLCDGVRCDMAMLTTREIFTQSWGGQFEGPQPEFWPAAIAKAKAVNPSFLLIAEAYDMGLDMPYKLQQFGFDFTYDKLLYDRLAGNDIPGVVAHLAADIGYQRRLVRFIENHDEARALSHFGFERSKLAAITATTVPGMKLLHQGQLEGASLRIPVQLARRTIEPPRFDGFYPRLLGVLKHPVFDEGQWRLLSARPAWPGNDSHAKMITYCWRHGEHRRLIALNLDDHRSQGYVPLHELQLTPAPWRFRDELGTEVFLRDGAELLQKGIYLDMPALGYHLFAVEPHDDPAQARPAG
jgi:hypothetical protein